MVGGIWGRRTSPTPQPGLAWGHEQVTDGRSFTQFITNQLCWKNPMWAQQPCPDTAGWQGPRWAGSLTAVLELREWENGGFHCAVPSGPWALEICLLPLLPPLPRGSQVPFPAPAPAPQRLHRAKLLSVCPADCLPRDPASPHLPSPAGFSGVFLSPSRSLCSGLSEEATSGIWGHRSVRAGPRASARGWGSPPRVLGASGLESGRRRPAGSCRGRGGRLGKLWRASGGEGGASGGQGKAEALRF